ncbi:MULTISPECIES: hypothetical protein [Syntrophotalea]|jgi:hypothetical protein|uniref:HTH merR-type domain-containing protein n=1 Tax=Syntrophotalea acetylenica TaxID=29542 RepID=A0A1L3GI62_SYNAC|nr:hypothetical protein [Syntrophotalea acetylenica]APG25565.1 hypothetical protein A7E75_11465 [Syntrophotalea acetylenica]APG43632.1 hypothetical protein A6070_05480 [Syntrophotalea acetylenica]MDY0263485.1 hypothetical protein [Syntrophotalea acetylenica]
MDTVSHRKQLLDIDEVAMKLGTTPLNVLLYIKRGELNGEENEGNWYVESQSLEALISGQDGGGAAPCTPACGHGNGCGGCH